MFTTRRTGRSGRTDRTRTATAERVAASFETVIRHRLPCLPSIRQSTVGVVWYADLHIPTPRIPRLQVFDPRTIRVRKQQSLGSDWGVGPFSGAPLIASMI